MCGERGGGARGAGGGSHRRAGVWPRGGPAFPRGLAAAVPPGGGRGGSSAFPGAAGAAAAEQQLRNKVLPTLPGSLPGSKPILQFGLLINSNLQYLLFPLAVSKPWGLFPAPLPPAPGPKLL